MQILDICNFLKQKVKKLTQCSVISASKYTTSNLHKLESKIVFSVSSSHETCCKQILVQPAGSFSYSRSSHIGVVRSSSSSSSRQKLVFSNEFSLDVMQICFSAFFSGEISNSSSFFCVKPWDEGRC